MFPLGYRNYWEPCSTRDHKKCRILVRSGCLSLRILNIRHPHSLEWTLLAPKNPEIKQPQPEYLHTLTAGSCAWELWI